MASSRTKQFLICYESQTIELALPENATVEDLQFELFLKTNVHPIHQNIEGLPEDVQTLDSLSNERVLWLSNSDEEAICDRLEPTDVLLTISIENIRNDISKLAASGFIDQFICNYGDKYVATLKNCSLSEALQNSCLAPFEHRKLLAFYLHNEHDLFSKMFCPTLVNGEIRNILERSFHVVAWDLLSGGDDALKEVVDQWTELEVTKSWITRKQSVLFILHPYENSFAIYTAVYGNTEVDHLERILVEIENNFQPVQQEKKSNSIGSQEFQQMMFDRLGDRDYDSFQADEFRYLKEKIGFAKFGPPMATEYDIKQQKNIEQTFDVIKKYSNKFSEWKDHIVVSFIYNCLEPLPREKLKRSKKYSDYQAYSDIMPIPLFVIPKCTDSLNPCRVFIDHQNRVYSSWEKYKKHNNLHKCLMVLPVSGRYNGNSNGDVQLEKIESPSCSIGHSVLQGTDIVSSVAGIASGAVIVAAAIPGIIVAPIAIPIATVTGIGVGAYGIIRSAVKIGDRAAHDETMSFANSEARGAYLNIVAGSLGFVGAGATQLVAGLAAKGVNIGQGAKIALNVLNATNIGTGAAGIVNSSYEVFDNWKEGGKVSSLTVVQLTSSILFFGNAIFNFRTANAIIEEAQVNTLKSYQDSLKNNKLKKTFDKLLKETTRQTGNVQNSRSEVISTLSNFGNKNEILSILLRNNKLFNKEGVRFAAKNGKITLNGIAIDINELMAMPSSQKITYLVGLPSIPATATITEINTMSTIFETIFTPQNATKVLKYVHIYFKNKSVLELTVAILKDFSEPAKIKLLKIFEALLIELDILDIPLVHICKKYIPNWDPYLFYLKCVVEFVKVFANTSDLYPKSWIEGTNTGIFWTEKFLNSSFLSGGSVNKCLLEKLIEFVITKITDAMASYCIRYEKIQNRIRDRSKTKVCCSDCGGFTFVLK